MTTPESDFQTWLVLASSMIEDISGFHPFATDLVRLIDSIIETSKLPKEIEDQTETFISKLKPDFLLKLFRLGYVGQEDMKYIIDFLKSVLRLSIWGVKNNNTKAIPLAEDILSVMSSATLITYNRSCDLETLLPKYTAENCFYESAMNLIDTQCVTVTTLSLITNICIRISTFVDDFNFFSFGKKVISSLSKYIKMMIQSKKIRDVVTLSIGSIFSALKHNAVRQSEMDEEFVGMNVDLLKTIMQPENFEKRLFSFRSLQELVTTKETAEYAIEFIAKDPSFLDGSILHEAFTPHIATILKELCKARKISFSLITTLFERHSVQYITELPKFYSIFSTIAPSLPLDYLESFVYLIMYPKVKNAPWYEMITNIGVELGTRKDSADSFKEFRNILFKLSDEGDQEATKVLGKMLQYHIDQAQFDETIEKFTSGEITEKTFIAIKNLCASYPFSDTKKAENLIDKAIEIIADDKVTQVNEVLDCVFNLSFINGINFTKENLEKLYPSFRKSITILTFFIEMIDSELIDFEALLQTISNEKGELTDELVDFVNKIVKKKNDCKDKLTKLPFVGEDVMWELCSRKGVHQHTMCKSLCEIYASNDGVELPDDVMINTFLQKWSDKLENATNKLEFIVLLRTFILTIESSIDISAYNVIRHKPVTELIEVTLSGALLPEAKVLKLPSVTTIAALFDMISRISGVNQSFISIDTVPMPGNKNKTLLYYARNGAAKFVCNRIKDITSITYIPPHKRSCVPSVILSESPICEKILQLLKEDVNGVMQLLELLPTTAATVYQINVLRNVPTFDYKSFLDIEYPSLFIYNLEGLTSRLDEKLMDAIKKTGGIKYIFESIPKTLNKRIIEAIIKFIKKFENEEFIEEYKQLVFDNAMAALAQFVNDNTLSVLIGTFIQRFTEGKKKIVCTESNKYVRFLLSSTEDIRKQFCLLLSKVECDQNAFTSIINEADTLEFFKVFAVQIKENDEKLVDIVLSKIKEELTEKYLLLAVPLIEKNFIPEEKKNELLDFLMDKFLVINNEARDKEVFILISKIVSKCDPDKLYDRIKSLHDKKSTFEKTRINGDTSETKTGFVGLVNLGATCFLNSTLQQFFMIPIIRKYILEYKGEDEFMQELSKLYAKLLLSNCRSVTTEDLVKKWKGWGGEPMNPREQQDACEFVQMLIDKLESGIGVDIIHNLFRASTKQVIEGINEKYLSERFDNQYTVTLSVKDSADMTAALDKLATPDFFTDENQYKPEGWDHKIDAKKYNSLDVVPPYLIIQLARFDYNYQTWERIKINSKFDVPVDLDLSGRVSKTQEHTKYHLHGIIMHFGSAQFGHYISYVKERKPDGKWYCFNDQSVTQMTEEGVLKSASGEESGRSGYILFYDRDDYENIEVSDPVIGNETQEAVENENDLNAQYRLFCSEPYFNLMESFSLSDNRKLHKLAMRYAFDSYPFTACAGKKASSDSFFTNITKRMEENESIAFIKDYIEAPLMKNPIITVREGIAEILLKGKGIEPSFYISLFDNALNEYRLSEKFFKVCSKLCSNEPEFAPRALKFLRDDVFEYKEAHKELREEFFYGGLDVSEIAEGLSNNKLGEEASFLVEDKYLTYLVQSCEPLQLSKLLKCLPESAKCNEKVKSFAERCSIYVPYLLLVSLLILLLGNEGIEMVPKIKGKVAGKLSTSQDLTTAHLMIISEEGGPEFYFDKLGNWFIDLLLDEDKFETRQNAAKMMCYLAPTEKLIELPTNIDSRITLKAPVKRDCKEEAQKIVDFLTESIPYVISKVQQKYATPITTILPYQGYIAAQFIELLDALSADAKVAPESVDKLLDGFMTCFQPYDVHVKLTINLAAKAGTLKTPDFFLSLIDFKPIEKGGYVSRCHQFLDVVLPRITDDIITDEYAKKFVRTYCFPTGIIAHIGYGVIVKHLERLAVHHKQALIEAFDEMGVENLKEKNYTGTLAVLKAANEKRPVLESLPKAFKTKSFFTTTELIRNAFECDDGTPIKDVEEIMDLVSYATIQGYNQETRACVWKYMTENHVPTAELFVRRFGEQVIPEDSVLFVKFIISSFEHGESLEKSVEARKAFLKTCSSNISAMEAALDWIKKVMEALKDYDWHSFIKDSLKLSPYKHVECFSELVVLATKVATSEDDVAELLSPFYQSINSLTKLISCIVACEGELPAEELGKLKDSLAVVGEHNVMTGCLMQEVGKLISELRNTKKEYDPELLARATKVVLV